MAGTPGNLAQEMIRLDYNSISIHAEIREVNSLKKL